MVTRPARCAERCPEVGSAAVVFPSPCLFAHVRLSHRLPFIPLWWLQPCSVRIWSLLWWDPYPEWAFRHCYNKGSCHSFLRSNAKKGGKCSGSLLKEVRWWLTVTLTPPAHVRDQGIDASLPPDWASLHTCLHVCHVIFTMSWKKEMEIYCSCPWQEVGLDDLWRSLPTQTILWFYIRNYTITLWDLNWAYASDANPTLGLAYQLPSNMPFRFLLGSRVALPELGLVVNDGLCISFCICTKRSQKAQCGSRKIEVVFCSFRGSGSWNDLQQEVTHWDFQSWSAWMGANRSKFLCSDYVWFRNHGSVLTLCSSRLALLRSRYSCAAFEPQLAHGQPAWSTGRVSSRLPASTHRDRVVKLVFNRTARTPFLRIPGLNEHHTDEPGLWVCLD